MQPKLSVIIPVYNVEKYIRQCLDSVYSQTFRDFEVIIIDYGSPDNCGKICDEYAERFGNDILTKVIHKENGGLTRAWSDGLESATGVWVTFVDSDDWIEKDYYENMFDALGNSNADVFCSGGCYKNKEQIQTESYCFDSPKLYCTREERDYIMTRVLTSEKNGNVVFGATQALWDKFYRLEFLRENGLHFETSMNGIVDVLFNFIAFDKANCIGVSTVCGYHYRQVANSDTRRFNPKRKDSFITFLNIANNYLAQNKSNPVIKKSLNAYALSLIINALGTYFCNKNNPKSSREIAKEFVEYKKSTYIAEAIHDRNNPYIPFKRKILQFMLRLPGFAPTKFIYTIQLKISAKRRTFHAPKAHSHRSGL